jgi:hypothetical protein
VGALCKAAARIYEGCFAHLIFCYCGFRSVGLSAPFY